VNPTVTGFSRISKFFFCLTLAALSVSLAGCGKIKTAFQSLLHPNRSSNTNSIPQPPRSVSTPQLAIILDDVAGDPAAMDAIFALHYPLTLSVLPNHPRSTSIAREAQRRGYEVMLHLPMESLANETPESQEIRPGMSAAEVSSELNAMLRSVPNAAGVNNHQGSLATSDARLMSELMPLLLQRHLFFIDSRTTAATVAYQAAESAGVPCAFRNVPFLDDVQEFGAIRHQLEIAAKEAREKGQAIAIAHPHPESLRALGEFLPRAEAQGIHLVHASALVH
jgi:polysaccharide deacetylase 2 family uncharacterized protein YibQ